MHFFYLLVFIFYVIEACLKEYHPEDTKEHLLLAILLLLGILYPVIYESISACKVGLNKYIKSSQNMADLLYIWGSVINVVFQFRFGPHHIASRSIMTILVLAITVKTFFFLSIYKTLTFIVVMLTNVIYDLKIFMFFFIILIFMLA